MKLVAVLLIISIFVKENFPYSNNNNEIQTRVFGGKVAGRKQFPYQALILLETGSSDSKIGNRCSGALISDQYVLTAAHCLYNKTEKYPLFVTLGAHDQYNDQEEGQETYKINPNNTLIHENFNIKSKSYDVALIKLPEKVEFNEYIQPVILPNPGMTDLVGQHVFLSGWGTTSYYRTMTDILHYIETTIISLDICRTLYRAFNFSDKFQLCVYSKGKSACLGDSGSPIVLRTEDKKNILIGIHSSGDPDCTFGNPQVSGRIQSFLQWIRENTNLS